VGPLEEEEEGCGVSHEILKKHNISSASERAFLGFFGDNFGCSTLSKRGVLVRKNSLASCQWCRHSVEPRALTCPFNHSDLYWSM